MGKTTDNDSPERVTDLDIEKYTRQFNKFIDSFGSLQLATVDSEGEPEASYAPYLKIDGDFYIYVSELSRHTMNIMNNGKVAILFIENEDDASNLFARRRVTYRTLATGIERGSDSYTVIMEKFEMKFGKFMAMLRQLSDFHLFRLRPQAGTFVAGFGRAFQLDGERLDRLRHVNNVNQAADNKQAG